MESFNLCRFSHCFPARDAVSIATPPEGIKRARSRRATLRALGVKIVYLSETFLNHFFFTDKETDKIYISAFKRRQPLTFSPNRQYVLAVVSPLQQQDSCDTGKESRTHERCLSILYEIDKDVFFMQKTHVYALEKMYLFWLRMMYYMLVLVLLQCVYIVCVVFPP